VNKGAVDRDVAALTGSVGQRFTLRSRSFNYLFCAGYEALDSENDERCLCWVFKNPFPAGSDSVRQQFLERMSRLAAEDFAFLPAFKCYGVDASPSGYLATGFVSGKSLAEMAKESFVTRETIFLKVLHICSELHQKGYCVGDFSEDSMVWDSSGRIWLTSLMGVNRSHEISFANTPHELTNFLAPEIFRGGLPTQQSDVFALGVWGYRLFTGRYLTIGNVRANDSNDIVAEAPAPSQVSFDAPRWLDEVIGRCLDKDPGRRYLDSASVLEEILHWLKYSQSPSAYRYANKWSSKSLTALQRRSLRISAVHETSLKDNQGATTNASSSFMPLLRGRALIITGLVLATIFLASSFIVGGMFYLSPETDSGGGWEIYRDKDLPSDLRSAYLSLGMSELPLDKRAYFLKTIADSSDPAVYPILVEVAQGAFGPDLSKASQSLIVDRVEKSGLIRSAKLIKHWFSVMSNLDSDVVSSGRYWTLLRVADVNLSREERNKSLYQSFAHDPDITIQLAAALAFDEDSHSLYVDAICEFLQAKRADADCKGKSLPVIVLAFPELDVTYGADAVKSISKLPSGELIWLLERLSERPRSLLYSVAEELISRRAMPPFQSEFLSALQDESSFSLPFGVRGALVRGSLGKLRSSDYTELSVWPSEKAERILFAASAFADNDNGSLVVDALSKRELTDKLIIGIIAWLQKTAWQSRASVAKPIGLIGLRDISSDDQLEYAFEELARLGEGEGLVSAAIDGGDARMIAIVVGRFGSKLSSRLLLGLLKHEDKGVRIVAVRSLRGRRELAVLQTVSRRYGQELDPEVIDEYRKDHWVSTNEEKEEVTDPE